MKVAERDDRQRAYQVFASDVMHRFTCGDPVSEIAQHHGVPRSRVEDVIRDAIRQLGQLVAQATQKDHGTDAAAASQSADRPAAAE